MIVTYSYRVTRMGYGKRLPAMEKYICGHTKVETCGLPVQWPSLQNPMKHNPPFQPWYGHRYTFPWLATS
jgi:hypothetical protein